MESLTTATLSILFSLFSLFSKICSHIANTDIASPFHAIPAQNCCKRACALVWLAGLIDAQGPGQHLGKIIDLSVR